MTAASESVHVVSNPGALVASEDLKDDYTNNLGKGNLSVQIEKQASTIVSNPEHNVEGSTHYTKLVDTVAGLGVFTAVSITVEPFDQQSADNQDATSEHHCNSEDNLTGTKDSVATIPSVCTTDAEQYITGPCDPQQATSPCGSLTKDSLPGYKRYIRTYINAHNDEASAKYTTSHAYLSSVHPYMIECRTFSIYFINRCIAMYYLGSKIRGARGQGAMHGPS